MHGSDGLHGLPPSEAALRRRQRQRAAAISERMKSVGELQDVVKFLLQIAIAIFEVFEKMKAASELPDVIKFSRLFTQHGETKKAEDICEKMRSAGELPDGLTFNSLSVADCAKQGEVKKADEVFDNMKSASELPDEVKLNSLIIQYGETNKAEEICV